MLIDITSFIGSFCVENAVKSFSDSKINLYQATEGEIDMIKGTVDLDAHTLVMTTISSRGRLCCLIAFPRIISDRPLE